VQQSHGLLHRIQEVNRNAVGDGDCEQNALVEVSVTIQTLELNPTLARSVEPDGGLMHLVPSTVASEPAPPA
jgi:hypothetical protein